jgi:hypothetical protein
MKIWQLQDAVARYKASVSSDVSAGQEPVSVAMGDSQLVHTAAFRQFNDWEHSKGGQGKVAGEFQGAERDLE